jgi:lysophospholipid acyltransferase (LPLAT)-like uncharacterized protein
VSRLSAEIKRWLLWPAALILRLLVAILGRTYRFRILHPERLEELLLSGRPVIVCFWHNQIFAACYFIRKELTSKGFKMTLLASHSRDGELVARFARNWKLRTVRGSASRGGVAAIRALHRSLVKDASSPILIPDGPRGPQFECKPGAILLSQFSRAPILPLGFAAGSSWNLKSWDRIFVPRFWSRVAVTIGAPIQIPRNLDDAEREVLRAGLEEELNALRAESQSAVGDG